MISGSRTLFSNAVMSQAERNAPVITRLVAEHRTLTLEMMKRVKQKLPGKFRRSTQHLPAWLVHDSLTLIIKRLSTSLYNTKTIKSVISINIKTHCGETHCIVHKKMTIRWYVEKRCNGMFSKIHYSDPQSLTGVTETLTAFPHMVTRLWSRTVDNLQYLIVSRRLHATKDTVSKWMVLATSTWEIHS